MKKKIKEGNKKHLLILLRSQNISKEEKTEDTSAKQRNGH